MRLLKKLPLFCLFFVFASGCGSTKKVVKNIEKPPVLNDSLKVVKSDSLTTEELKQLRKILSGLKDVPFDFDKSSIPQHGLDSIKINVNVLNNMLEARGKYIHILLEGHCDDRGSTEYNLALGEKRANTVRDYLITVGFKEKSLKTLSYGEERPKVQGNTQEAWAANRRVHLVVE